MRILAKLAWRGLWRHPVRTALTASAVAFGLGLLLVMLGLGDGSHLQMVDAAARMGGGHVLVQAPGYHERRSVERALPAPVVARLVEWARARPDVRAVLPRAFVSGLLSSADGAAAAGLVGIDAEAEAAVSRFAERVAAGRFLASGDGAAAVVGRGVARLLRARPGARIVAMAQGPGASEVRSILLPIVGVVATGLDEIDRSLVLVPLPFLQEWLGFDGGAHQVALLLRDQALAVAVSGQARATFPGVEILTWAEADPQLDAAIRMDDGGHYLVNGIFLLIVAFMVFNTLLMSVLERRRELALLGALGLSPRRCLALVALEGSMVGGLGVAGGLVLGLSAHAFFAFHGLPLSWFTDQDLEAAGVVLDPVMYSALGARRVIGAACLVTGLALALALLAARRAWRPADPRLLKTR